MIKQQKEKKKSKMRNNTNSQSKMQSVRRAPTHVCKRVSLDFLGNKFIDKHRVVKQQ